MCRDLQAGVLGGQAGPKVKGDARGGAKQKQVKTPARAHRR
jgi:hypothetical protein